MPTYIECGCCGGYHFEGYEGDCRNDEERWTYAEVIHAGMYAAYTAAHVGEESPLVNIVTLEDQVEEV